MSDGKTQSTMDFSTLPQHELTSALKRINREKFPANYAACLAEIQRRKDQGLWSEAAQEATPKRAQFSLKRRLVAYLVDGFALLGISILFWPLSDFLNSLGEFGVIPFWVLNFLYVATLDGPLGKGQTLGKYVTKLKVINRTGGVISWKQASWRGIYFVLIIAVRFGLYDNSTVIVEILDGLVLTLCVLNVVCIIKHPQQRSFVDLLADTLIQDVAAPVPEVFEGYSALAPFKVWFAVPLLVILGAFLYPFDQGAPLFGEKTETFKSEIAADTNARYLGGGSYRYYKNGALVAEGTNLFFWMTPEDLGNIATVKEQSKKIRHVMVHGGYAAPGAGVIVVSGRTFYGLVPTSTVFRNADVDPDPSTISK